jgi:hypothetical protein
LARRGAIELARTGVTFEQAAIEWLRWGEHERGWKRSTLVDRRSALKHHLLPEFRSLPLNQVTARRVEGWKIAWLAEHDARRPGRQAAGDPSQDHGWRAQGVRLAEQPRRRRRPHPRQLRRGALHFYSPEEVYALARAAASKPDAALFLTADSRACAGVSSSRCARATSTSRSARSASRDPSPAAP